MSAIVLWSTLAHAGACDVESAYPNEGGARFDVGVGAIDVVAADMNHDGATDLVVTCLSEGTVQVLFGAGDGTFGAAETVASGLDLPYLSVVGDFNDDGVLDIIVSVSGGLEVNVYQGSGGAEFALVNQFFYDFAPATVVAADFNGDGALDLATALPDDGRVAIRLGEPGTFTFLPAGGISGLPGGTIGLDVADFDHDGALDVVVAAGAGDSIHIAPGFGDGTFAPTSAIPAGNFPYTVRAADLNGDGTDDLVVRSQLTDTLDVFLGNGDGTMTAGVPITSAGGAGRIGAVQIDDLDRDGALDLVIVDIDVNALRIVPGHGDGTFGASFSVALGNASPSGIAVADLDGNHSPDLVASSLAAPEVEVVLSDCGCRGDFDLTGGVGYEDLVTLLAWWGPCPTCPADLTGDAAVTFEDVMELFVVWGPC